MKNLKLKFSLFLITGLLAQFAASAQLPSNLQPMNGFGFSWNAVEAKFVMNIPNRCDTNFTTAYRAVLKPGSTFWNNCTNQRWVFFNDHWQIDTVGGHGGGSGLDTTALHAANNLGDLPNKAAALDNLNISQVGRSNNWGDLSGLPTTIAESGITDAVPSVRSITINGVTHDLTNNMSFSVSGAAATDTSSLSGRINKKRDIVDTSINGGLGASTTQGRLNQKTDSLNNALKAQLIANQANSKFLGFGTWAARPSAATGPGFYYASGPDSIGLFYTDGSVYTRKTDPPFGQFHVYFQKGGGRGIMIGGGHDSVLVFKGLVDSGCIHLALNPDSTIVIYSTCSAGSGFDSTTMTNRIDSVSRHLSDSASATAAGRMTINDFVIIHTKALFLNDTTTGADTMTYAVGNTHYDKRLLTYSADNLIQITKQHTAHATVYQLKASVAFTDTSYINAQIFTGPPDGVHDNTAGFQAAWNYAAANHKNIFIPYGNYIDSSQLTAPTTGYLGVCWASAPGATINYKPKTGAAFFYTSAAYKDITFLNLQLFSDHDTTNIGANGILMQGQTLGSQIRRVKILGGYIKGFAAPFLGKAVQHLDMDGVAFLADRGHDDGTSNTTPNTMIRAIDDSSGDANKDWNIHNCYFDGFSSNGSVTTLKTLGPMDGAFYGHVSGLNFHDNFSKNFAREHVVYQPGITYADSLPSKIHDNVMDCRMPPGSKSPSGTSLTAVTGIRAEGQNLSITGNDIFGASVGIQSYATAAWDYVFRGTSITNNRVWITTDPTQNPTIGFYAQGFSTSKHSKMLDMSGNRVYIDSVTFKNTFQALAVVNYDSSFIGDNKVFETRPFRTGGGVWGLTLNNVTGGQVGNNPMIGVDTPFQVISSSYTGGTYQGLSQFTEVNLGYNQVSNSGVHVYSSGGDVYFDHQLTSGNIFFRTNGGANILTFSPLGNLIVPVSTTAGGGFVLPPSAGVSPTSPQSGQLWNDATHLWFHNATGNHDLLSASGGGGITNPMTTLGDIIVAGTGGTPQRFGGNVSSNRQFYISQGAAGAATAPILGPLASGDIPNNTANTTGSAGSLSAATQLPNGMTAVLQATADNGDFVASDKFVHNVVNALTILTGSGSLNRIAYWTSAGGLGISAMFHQANAVGINQSPLYTHDIYGPSGVMPSVHLSIGLTDNGGYWQAPSASETYLSGGAVFGSSVWTAKGTSAGIFGTNAGALAFYGNTGLTSNSTYTPTQLWGISASGGERLYTYGVGSHSGTPAFNASFDAFGNIIETALNSGPNLYNADGTLTGNRQVLGAGKTLAFGTPGSNLGGFSVTASGPVSFSSAGSVGISLNGPVNFVAISTASSTSDYSSSTDSYIKLPTPTANHTVTLPTGLGIAGRLITVINQSTSTSFSWSFVTTVTDPSGNTISAIPNGASYTLLYDGTSWILQNNSFASAAASAAVFTSVNMPLNTNYQATGTDYGINVPSANSVSVTITLPNSPANGRTIVIFNRSSHTQTLAAGTGGASITDASANFPTSIPINISWTLQYNSGMNSWLIIAKG